MMRSITLPGGARVRTSAKSRYLIIGHYAGARPAVEATANSYPRAIALVDRYRRQFPHTTWHLMDQAPSTERNP